MLSISWIDSLQPWLLDAEPRSRRTHNTTVDRKEREEQSKHTQGHGCCERLAYYGMSTNLLLYFKNNLNQHSATASKNLSNWSGTCYLTQLLGALVADSYLGRYWTIAIFSIIYVMGMTLLTISAAVPGLKPTCISKENCHSTSTDIAITYLALYLVALGTGGIKPCASSYGADQFDDSDEVEKKHKSSFFTWFYLSINVGSLIASTLLVWIQDNVGWGSVRASWRKRTLRVPGDKSALYETTDIKSAIVGSRKLDHTEDLSFLDKAAMELQSDHDKGSADPWRLCTVTQVEELKSIIKLLPVWATGIIFSAVYSQMSNLFVLQGSSGVWFMTRYLSPLQENTRATNRASRYSNEWALVPQYFLIGCAEVFTMVGKIEFFYDQAPDSMRSLCSALALTTNSLGNYLSSLLVTIVMGITTEGGKAGWIPDNLNRGHFWLLTVLSVLNLGAFLLVAKRYTYKKTAGTLR
ncbi:NRT1/ PTR family 8.2-like protein [Tanacetum coccineum]